MTLILGVLTGQYVALMSDRRVTVRRGSQIESQEDTDTKVIALGGQFLMGFTGLARIGGFRVEVWASDVLMDVPQEDYFQVLRQEVERAFVREGHAARIPHAFLAVGYAAVEPEGPVVPLCITVSNSLDERGRFSTAVQVSREFGISSEQLGNQRQLVVPAGWPVNETAFRSVERSIRTVVRGDPSNPALSVEPLLIALRDTAGRSAGHVGTAAIFASMPASALPEYGMMSGEPDYATEVASTYLSDEARSADDAVMYAPAVINEYFHVVGSEYGPVPDGALSATEGSWPERPFPPT